MRNPSPCSVSARARDREHALDALGAAGHEHAELVAAEPVGGPVRRDGFGEVAPSRRSRMSPAGWPKLSL